MSLSDAGESFILSDSQKRELLKLARASVRAAADGVLPRVPPTEEPENSVMHVRAGVFVTLYSPDGKLRGCIGFVEGEHPLRETVSRAAVGAAIRDPRFSPVHPDEVENLELSISLLSPAEDVEDPGEIEVGRDGLIVRKGFRQGLLLPQVAAERGWDRERFLQETCRKAGLPLDAWREEGSRLRRFTAVVLEDRE
jgi:AmmeMemoRadiSam system protein A